MCVPLTTLTAVLLVEGLQGRTGGLCEAGRIRARADVGVHDLLHLGYGGINHEIAHLLTRLLLTCESQSRYGEVTTFTCHNLVELLGHHYPALSLKVCDRYGHTFAADFRQVRVQLFHIAGRLRCLQLVVAARSDEHTAKRSLA